MKSPQRSGSQLCWHFSMHWSAELVPILNGDSSIDHSFALLCCTAPCKNANTPIFHLLSPASCCSQLETPLLRSFKTLHDHLQGVDDLADVDAPMYLRPFLDVVRSADASGPITGIALQAINKFILYGLVNEDTIGAAAAVNAVVMAAARCKFESSSSSGDETTLMQLLELVENTVRCSAGRLATGDAAWEAC